MIQNLLINVLAGFICFIIGVIWKTTILPSLQKLTYHGVKIEGRWKIIHERNTCNGTLLSILPNTIMQLSQKAFRISGSATSTFEIDGENQIIEYDIEGHIKDRFLTLSFKNKSKDRFAQSIFLLDLKGDANELHGYRTFYSLLSSEINAMPCTWKRVI